MQDTSKTKKQLINELNELRGRLKADKKSSHPRSNGYIDITNCHALLDNITDYTYICDNQGKILYVSKAIEALSGYCVEDFIDKTFESFFDKKNLKIALDVYSRTLQGESPKYELTFKKTGIVCAYNNLPLKDKKGKIIGVLGSARDISTDRKAREQIKCAFDDLTTCIQERTDELSIEIEERKRTEKELKKAKETYEGMFLNSMVGMARTRISDGKFIEINDRLLEMFGYDDKEDFITNSNVYNRYAIPGERDRMLEQIKETGEVENFETLVKRKDGSTFLIQFSGRVNKEGGYLDTVSVDIDEQRRAEEALKEATRTYESMFLNSMVGLSRTRLSDGKFLEINDRLVEMFGYDDRGDFVKNYSAVKCYAVEGERERAMGLIKKHGEIKNFETLAKRKDGSTFWIQYSGKVDVKGGYLDSVSLDVTERKEAEEALKVSEEKYRTLIDNMNDGFAIVDKDGIITFINNKICDLIGYSETEIIGSPIFSFVDEANKKIFFDQIAKREKGINEAYEIEYTRKDGSKVPTIVSPEPLYDNEGNFSGSFAVVTDITEFKKLSERIEALNKSFLGFGTDSAKNILSLTHLLGSLMNGTCALYNRIDHDMLCTIAEWNTPDNFDLLDKPEGHICYDVIRNNDDDIFYISDLSKTKYAKTDNNVVKHNLKSYIGKAVTCNGKHIGSICVVFTHEFTPSDEDKRYLEIIAVAIGIEEERKLAGEKLARARENSRNLAMHIQSMQEQERGRIARDIHDDLGQLLTALDFDLAFINKRLHPDQTELLERTKKMAELIRVSTETVQRIASELRPALLDNLGLIAAMEWQADEYSAHTGITCELNLEPSVMVKDKNLSTALFRAFQEALTNVARHSSASKVCVNFKQNKKGLILKISDNGNGISEKEITAKDSFGISGIMERFYPFGGIVKIKGVKNIGTTVSIKIPLGEKK